VTRPLLDVITDSSLDRDYAAAAARRRASPQADKPSSRTAWLPTAIAVAVFGLLVCTAFVQTRSRAADDLATRGALLEQINDRKATTSALQDRAGRLQATNGRLQQRLDTTDAEVDSAATRVQRLRSRTGYGAVQGEGVRITVANPPDALPLDQVRDTDLAALVDGLWAAGAEAVSINGHRLTALTEIRNSSFAVHVGGQPLSPPYVVEAIGDTRVLQARLLSNGSGSRFFSTAAALDFAVTRQNVERLRLPAGRLRALRYATPLEPRTEESS
jgi:uncharacterized protein YlxW (UPF0749 family)